jgi:hypothetical protein
VRRRLGIACAAVACVVACSRAPAHVGDAPADPLAQLRAFEAERREGARFLEAPPSDRTLGADPYDLVALPGGGFVAVLHGDDAVVLVDDALGTRARAKAPRAPSAIAVYAGAPRGGALPGDVFVTSEIEPVVARYRATGGRLERLADLPLEGVRAARDVAVGPEGAVHVVEDHDDRLVTLGPAAGARHERRVGAGPIRLARTRGALFVASLVDHTIVALPVDREGVPGPPLARVVNDGPFWALDAIDVEGGTLVVATGVEDHPLDRREGFFGWIDSFVYVWFLARGSRELARVAAIDASDAGVVVPKAVAFDRSSAEPRAVVAAYGSSRLLRLAWPRGASEPPVTTTAESIPGQSAIVASRGGVVGVSPLLDAIVRVDDGVRVVHVDAPRPDRDRERLGEALFFTQLMAPANVSDGAKSRFTCETCHFEGYVDGRTHHTGRGDVRATTKPLLGLFNNRPHFTRALDPDLAAVAENEFRVAGAGSETDPHFSVDVDRTPWLGALRLARRSYDAKELRLSLMAFLMTWTHRTNPRVAGRTTFTREEREGAAAFRDRCEGCHEARSAADDAGSRLPFERWEPLVMSDAGPIVWAKDAYAKTGVTPYVHEKGARVPSLRRLYKKRPYFTNGSAKDLAAVVSRARFSGTTFSHDGTTAGEALDDATARAIVAFLDLL